MIIIQLFGGFGNQLFQYAAGRCLAEKHQTQLKLDIFSFEEDKLRKYLLPTFNIPQTFATREEIQRLKAPTIPTRMMNYFSRIHRFLSLNPLVTYKHETHFQFDTGFFSLPCNVYLEGHWQSEKYFKDIESIIRQEFRLKAIPNEQNTYMAGVIRDVSDSVSVHIRRGDYVSNPITYKVHGVCSAEYYHTAIEHITQKSANPHFFIFSDDPMWVEKNFKITYPHTYVTHNQKDDGPLDMWLMSLCTHHIIANSSFSWWGAWLANNPKKIVIAPKRWFNNSKINTSDLVPRSWLRF